LQHLFRHLARDIGTFVAAHRFKHTIAFALFAQVGAETYLAAFLTNKPIIADDNPNFAVAVTEPVHRPAGGAARFLVIQPDIAGTLGNAHIGEQGEDVHPFINRLNEGMADKRIIQRHNADNIHFSAQAADRGGHIVDGVNIIMQKNGGLRRAMPRECRLFKRLRQLLIKRV